MPVAVSAPFDDAKPAAPPSEKLISSLETTPQNIDFIRKIILLSEDRAFCARRSASIDPLIFGIPVIDAHLGGGLSPRALHEFAARPGDSEHLACTTRLLVTLLAINRHLHGPVLWACSRADLYPPGLAIAGFDPARLIVAETADAHIPAVMEEALRHRGLAAVIGETRRNPGLTLSRRLHLAAQAAGRPALLLRRFGTDDTPSAAATRWRIGPAVSPPPSDRLAALWLDPPRLHLDLIRCRGGMPASWTLTCHDDIPHPFSVAAPLADRPPAPRPATQFRRLA